MPSISLPIVSSGPIIPVGIGVSSHRYFALRLANQPIPSPFVGLGLIDTGANTTVIDPSVVNALGLVPTGSATAHTASAGGSRQTFNCYDIAIWFVAPSPSMVQPAKLAHMVHPSHITLPVMETSLAIQGFHALIGRDILEHCHLDYDGKNKRFTIAY